MHKFEPEHADILEDDNRISEIPPKTIFEVLPPDEGETVLDVGAGTGFLTFPLSERVGSKGKVYAIDIQEAMLEKLRDKIAKRGVDNIKVVKSKEEHIPLEESIAHKCYCVNVLHELKGTETLREVHRILQPSGKLCIIDWKKERSLRGPPLHERFSTTEAVKMIESVNCDVRNEREIGDHHFLIVGRKQGKASLDGKNP